MKRKFIINIIFLISVSLIVKAFWVLGVDRSVQNIVGEGEYGFYFSLFSFSVLFTLLLDLGIAGFNNKAVSADPDKINLYFGNIFIIRVTASAAYFIVTLIAALVLNYSERQISLLLVLMLNQIIASITTWLRSNISGLQHFLLDSILSVSDRLIMIIICSVILWGGVSSSPLKIEWFVYAQTAAYLSVMLISFIIVIKLGKINRFVCNRQVISDILKAGAPFAMVALFMTLYWRLDSVMLERILNDGKVQAGAYAQSFRLFDAFSMIPVMFGSMLLPVFSHEISLGHDLRPIVSVASKMLITPVVMLVGVFVTWPEEIIELLYKSPAHDSALCFRLLMISLIPVSIIYIYSTLLTASGRMKKLAFITGSAMAINLLLNILLIPRLTITGSAVSALCTQTLVASLCLILVHREMFQLFNKRKSALFAGLFLVTLFTGFFCRRLQIQWVSAMAFQGLIGIIWILVFRMVEPLKAIRLLYEKP